MNLTPENTMERILNGEDVTPSCRAEYFVKQAIDNAGSGGGGGDEYETVAEIAVGTMEHGDWYTYEEENVTAPEISSDITYYLNDEEMPSETVMVEGGMYGITWNTEDVEEGEPIDPSKPIVMVVWMNGGCRVMSDTDISNTTVTILKKVSGGGSISVDSALSDTSEKPVQNKVITAALEAAKPLIVTATLNTETMEISDASATLAQVLEAATAERRISFQLRATAEIEGVTVRAFDTFTDSSIKAYSNGTGEAVFSAVNLDDGTPLLCRIVAASGDHDGNWIYGETPLATANP